MNSNEKRLGKWGRDLYITAYPRVVHASEFLLAKGTFPATLAVGLVFGLALCFGESINLT